MMDVLAKGFTNPTQRILHYVMPFMMQHRPLKPIELN